MMNMYGHMCCEMYLEARGQLCWIASLVLPLMWLPSIKLRWPGIGDTHLYSLSHLVIQNYIQSGPLEWQ